MLSHGTGSYLEPVLYHRALSIELRLVGDSLPSCFFLFFKTPSPLVRLSTQPPRDPIPSCKPLCLLRFLPCQAFSSPSECFRLSVPRPELALLSAGRAQLRRFLQGVSFHSSDDDAESSRLAASTRAGPSTSSLGLSSQPLSSIFFFTR
ncbi:hypothetical protein CRG98_029581 [Punica granatum]|uniref:Uncharacterized protein n=1 Tax=Punica granatum TaxID=22663 RepID=A0A2I0J1A6_PUNGR|nr:hypothetical protein CRG98_029581 [Punica granatum]